jgi:hypothetical protein
MSSELSKDIRKVYVSQISSSTTAPTTLTVTNISTNNLLAVNSTISNLNLTGLTSSSIIGTNTTITNAVHTALTTSNLNVTSAILTNLTSTNLTSTIITSGSIHGSNTTITNAVHTSLSTGTLNLTSGIASNITTTNITLTSGLATSITSTSIIGTNTTVTNAVHTALSTSTLNLTTAIASTGITVGTLSANTSISSSSIQGTNSTITNLFATILSTSTLIATGITSGTLLATSISTGLLNSTNLSTSNLVSTNVSSSTLNLSTGLTTGTLLATTSISASQLLSTNISVGVLNSTGITTSTLLATTSISTGQLTANNISSSTLNVSTGITTSSLLVTGSITSGQLASANISTNNLYVTTLITGSNLGTLNISTGSLRATGPVQITSTRGILIGSSTDLDGGRLISAHNNTLASGGQAYITLGVGASTNNQSEFSFTYFTSGSTLNRTSIGLFGSPNTLSVLGSGNVGINNTNPAYTLDVNGTIDAVMYTGANISVSGAISSGSLTTGNLSSVNIQSSFNTITNLLISKSSSGWAPGLTIRPQAAGGENLVMFNNAATSLSNGSWYMGTQGGVTGGTFALGYAGQTNHTIVLTTSASVGINVTNPSYTLDVNGTFRVNGGSSINVQNQQDGGTGRGIYLWTQTDTNWGIYMGQAGASKSLSGGTAVAGTGFNAHSFRFRAGGGAVNGFIWENQNEALLASIRGSDGLAYFAGNVGIGKTPATNLDVNGTINATTFTGSNISISGSITSNNIAATGVITNGGYDFILGNSNQSARGNSGISRALVKDGAASLKINFAGDFTGGTEVQGPSLSHSGFFIASGNSNTLGNLFTTGGNVGIGLGTPTQIMHIQRSGSNNYLKIDAGGVSNLSGIMLSEYNINFGWSLRHDAGTDLLYISYQDNTPNFTNTTIFNRSGQIGINKTPGYTLDVNGNRLNLHSASGTLGGQNLFEGLENTSSRSQIVLSSSYSDMIIASSQANGVHGSTLTFASYNPDNKADYRKWVVNQGNWGARVHMLEFGYNPNNIPNPHDAIGDTYTTMTLDGTNKRLGLGTRTPDYQLTLTSNMGMNNGTVILSRNAAGSYENFLWPRFTDNMTYLNYGSAGFHIRNNASTSAMFMNNSTNIGIGTTAPAYKLDVNGVIKSNNDIILDSASRLTVFNNTGPLQIRSGGGNMLHLNQDNAGNISMGLGGGNVGIGTTAPNWKLDVVGAVECTDWFRSLGNTGWYNQTHGRGIYATDNTWVRTYPDRNAFLCGTLNCADITTNSNNIGMGTGIINFSTAVNVGLNWNTFSRIYDDGHLRMYTDDNMFFNIGGTNTGYMNTTGFGIFNQAPYCPLDIGGGTNRTSINGTITIFQYFHAGYGDNWMIGANQSTNSNLLFLGNTNTGLDICGFIENDASGMKIMNFTGQHRCNYDDTLNDSTDEGLIVCATGKYFSLMDQFDDTSEQDHIQINESLPIIKLASEDNDKSVFGVISYTEDPNKTRKCQTGRFVSLYDEVLGDKKRLYVNSLGEGAVWICNINGPFQNGDLITTSNLPGYGKKQNSTTFENYTLGKITMDCDFNPQLVPVKIIRKKQVTTTSKQKMTEKQTVTTIKKEIVLENDIWVEKEIEEHDIKEVPVMIDVEVFNKSRNSMGIKSIQKEQDVTITKEDPDLDENGQIVWIDKIDENGQTIMKPSYKIRYLNQNGSPITKLEYDELIQNNQPVYIAAFVGCTYHCG